MSWQRDASAMWDCVVCGAIIPSREAFYNGEPWETTRHFTKPVCLSCILTASASLLPGQPKSIRVEWLGASGWKLTGHSDPAALPSGQQYRLTVDGVEYGVMTVDAGIAEDQQVSALLALVRQALRWRAAGSLRPHPGPQADLMERRTSPREPLGGKRPFVKTWPRKPIVIHELKRPSDACSCLRPIFGRWHDIPSDRLAPYGLNWKWSALKGCKTCGGTGRVPPPSPFAPDYSWITAGLRLDSVEREIAAQNAAEADLHERIDAGLPIFIKNDPDLARAPRFSGQGVISPQVKTEPCPKFLPAPGRPLPREACLMHEGLPIGPDGLCNRGPQETERAEECVVSQGRRPSPGVVMPEKCLTCPFRDGGDVESRTRVTKRILTDASQICHHPRTHGKPETHLCRGARDLQLQVFHGIGFLSEPTDAAWEAACKRLGIGGRQ